MSAADESAPTPMESQEAPPPQEVAAPLPSRPFDVNPWRDATMVENFGPVMVFFSENHPGHHPGIGSIRLPKMSANRISDYVHRHQAHLKARGMHFWHAQNLWTNNAIGFGQKLGLDDFGMTVCVRHPNASYSPVGRNEVGLWALDFPQILAYANYAGPLSGKLDTLEDSWDVVLYANIFLMDEKKRRTFRQTEIAQLVRAPSPNGKTGTHVVESGPPMPQQPPHHQPPQRSSNPAQHQRSPYPVGHPNHQRAERTAPVSKRARVEQPGSGASEEKKQAKKIKDTEDYKMSQFFPKLPKVKGPIWSKNGMAPLPAALPEY